ncbi:MAG TPA: 6-carboxytetrahydropterin synthase [Caulobacteraceae bacterium]|nr:6-carboxytetrahydropterin synthase [Caulobacteraceae bacterium]
MTGPKQGAMAEASFEITKAATFDAAHRLAVPAQARYGRLHGHSFRVEASLRGPASAPAGWVEDLAALDGALREIAGGLDHTLLNDAEGLENPTLEALCLYFARRLKPRFASLSRIVVSRPSAGESCALGLD